ncbi:hypothetical protein MT418_006596 [Batrachochytrium dendrobatidis]
MPRTRKAVAAIQPSSPDHVSLTYRLKTKNVVNKLSPPHKTSALVVQHTPLSKHVSINHFQDVEEYEMDDDDIVAGDLTLVYPNHTPAQDNLDDNVENLLSHLQDKIRQRQNRSGTSSKRGQTSNMEDPLQSQQATIQANANKTMHQYQSQSGKLVDEIRARISSVMDDEKLNTQSTAVHSSATLMMDEANKTMNILRQNADSLCNDIHAYCQMQQAMGRHHEMSLRKIMMERERAVKHAQQVYQSELQSAMNVGKLKQALAILFK